MILTRFEKLRFLFFVLALTASTLGITFVCGRAFTNNKMWFGTTTLLPFISATLIVIFFLIGQRRVSSDARTVLLGFFLGFLAGAVAFTLNLVIGGYYLGRPMLDLAILIGDPMENLFSSAFTLTPIAGALSFLIGKKMQDYFLTAD